MASGPATVEREDVRLLQRLNRLAHMLEHMGTSNTDVERILRQVIESARELLPAEAVFIYLHTPLPGAGDTFIQGKGPIPSREQAFAPEGSGFQALSEEKPRHQPQGPHTLTWMPLRGREQSLGLLGVLWHKGVHPTPEHMLILESFVHLATLALRQTDRGHPEPGPARKRDELERLHRAGLLISSRLRLEDTLEAILQMALEVTGARYGILRLVDPEGENLIAKALAGERLSRPAVESLPINSTSITGWVAKHRRPLRVDDVRLPPWSRLYYPLDYDLEMRSELTVPLIGANGRLEGVINLESPRVAAFSEEDSHLLQALATQAVIAIQEARLLDALQDIAWRVLTEPLDRVLRHLVQRAQELLNVADAAIWLLQGDALALKAHTTFPPTHRIPVEGTYLGRAVRTRQPVLVPLPDPDLKDPCRAWVEERGWRTGLVVPLLTGEPKEPVGAFSVYATDERHFQSSDWDKKVLAILAHYAALAVHNERRQAALQAAQEQRAVAETFAAMGDVAANILHHLNNKVGTIPVRVEGLQEKYQDVLEEDPYMARTLEAIQESAREALQDVRDSLALLRPIRPGPVPLHACVQDALATVKIPPAVRVHISGLDALPPVLAGKESLTFVFTNLLQNAMEAMGGEGEIHIWGEEGPEDVWVHVRDSGPGIPAHLHERIFDFATSRRRHHAGHKLGFGLWWVKTLMSRLGGEVRVESRPSEGTTFHLRLPRATLADGPQPNGSIAKT